MKRLSLALLIGVVALTVVGVLHGCGGGGDDSESTTASADATATVGKAFVKQANDICRVARERQELIRRLAEENDEIGTSGNAKQEALETELIVGPYGTMIGEFESLQVTPAEADAKKALLGAFDERLAELEKDPDSAASGETSSNASALAAEYGLTKCVI